MGKKACRNLLRFDITRGMVSLRTWRLLDLVDVPVLEVLFSGTVLAGVLVAVVVRDVKSFVFSGFPVARQL